jgi:8-oxo-dGTP diphosphatase
MDVNPQLRPISTEIVLLAVETDCLLVLLTGSTGNWRLPGSPLGPEEDLDEAARKCVRDMGVGFDLYLEQLYTFGNPARDPLRGGVSVAYLGLMTWERAVRLQSPGHTWHRVEALPAVALDHGRIVQTAVRRLAAKLSYTNIGLRLVPSEFTLGELQQVFEAVTGESLDKRNFRKRIRALGLIQDTGRQTRRGRHRPARLYRPATSASVEFIK